MSKKKKDDDHKKRRDDGVKHTTKVLSFHQKCNKCRIFFLFLCVLVQKTTTDDDDSYDTTVCEACASSLSALSKHFTTAAYLYNDELLLRDDKNDA